MLCTFSLIPASPSILTNAALFLIDKSPSVELTPIKPPRFAKIKLFSIIIPPPTVCKFFNPSVNPPNGVFPYSTNNMSLFTICKFPPTSNSLLKP